MRPRQVMLITSVITMSAFGCTGSGEEAEREYAIPNPLCYVEMDPALYRPIFPPGGQVDVTNDYYEHGRLVSTGECIIEVDEELAIYIETRSVHPDDYGVNRPGVEPYVDDYRDEEGQRGTYEMEHGEQISEGPREAWVWSDFAAMSYQCESSNNEFTAVDISIRLDWVGDDDFSDPLAELIVPYGNEQIRMIGEDVCSVAE
jgi:hypothetical protein